MIFPSRSATSRHRSFSINPVGPIVPVSCPPWPGIDHDPPNLQSQGPRKRRLPIPRRRRRRRRLNQVRLRAQFFDDFDREPPAALPRTKEGGKLARLRGQDRLARPLQSHAARRSPGSTLATSTTSVLCHWLQSLPMFRSRASLRRGAGFRRRCVRQPSLRQRSSSPSPFASAPEFGYKSMISSGGLSCSEAV